MPVRRRIAHNKMENMRLWCISSKGVCEGLGVCSKKVPAVDEALVVDRRSCFEGLGEFGLQIAHSRRSGKAREVVLSIASGQLSNDSDFHA